MSMSPATLSNLYPLSDITTAIGYKAFVGKLRLLEIERAGAELRVAAGVPDLGVLKYEPHAAAPATISPQEMAKAAYKRNSRNTENVQRLLSILKNGTPPAPAPALSRSSSQSSESSVMTIHDIAEAAYKRNSLNTDNVQFMLSILNHGVPPSLSRSWSNSSSGTTSSLGNSTSASETSPGASSDCLPDCDGFHGCDVLMEEWECAEKWVDELVNDD